MVSTPELQIMADAAAGDARTAIGILRTAAGYADREGVGEITHDAIPEAKSEIHQKRLDKLNPHQQALCGIITDAGEIGLSDLYEGITEHVDNPKTKRMVRNSL